MSQPLYIAYYDAETYDPDPRDGGWRLVKDQVSVVNDAQLETMLLDKRVTFLKIDKVESAVPFATGSLITQLRATAREKWEVRQKAERMAELEREEARLRSERAALEKGKE